MALSPGEKLGPYEIQSVLGSGGMGEVYRARDTRLSRIVAIKILPLPLASDPLSKQRFEREAKTISTLNHPHICVLYDIGHQEGINYLVMECLEGQTLAKRLGRGPLPLDQALTYGVQIADALEKAHGHGIVHRDLKPANIMLTSSGAKLLDFGLAKPASALADELTLTGAETPPLTQQQTVVGTFQYMSPEQVQGKPLDWRSDIFSFGVVLYEMVTGKRAFEGKSQLSVASAIVEGEPAPLSSLKPTVPPALEYAIRRCLAKDPEERWQSAADLKHELEWIAHAGPDSGPARSPLSSSRRLKLYAISATAAALVLLGLLIERSASLPESPKPVRFILEQPPPAAIALTLSGSAVAFAPDGREIAYVVKQADTTEILLRDLGAFEGKLLAGTEGASTPFFSPDGRWIGFYADGKLKKISSSGGPPMVLCDAPEGNGASWLANDTIVFSADWREGLRRVPAAGGRCEVLTRPDPRRGEAFHWWPEALPGGQALLFTDQKGPGTDEASVAALSLASGTWRTVIEKGSNPHYLETGSLLVYLNGGALWAAPFDARNLSVTGPSFPVLQGFTVNPHFSTAQVAFSREGSIAYVPETGGHLENTLVKVDRAGHEQALTDIRRAYEDLALSPNGRFLALTVMGNPWSVWLYDLSRGTLGRLTFAGDNRDPIWTADSQRVIYASFRNGHFGLYWKPISGNESEEELITTASIPWPTSCSKDGKGCIYDLGIPEESAGVYLLPLFGERKPKAVVVEPFAGAGAISPDGKWAAYESRESGRTEIYVRPFPAGNRKWQVSTQGGTRPKWAASGRELFFREGEFRGQSRLVSVAIETEGEFRSSAPRILFPFHCEQAGHDYAVMPDGEHFLCIHESEAATRATQLNVVLNWNRELEKR